MPNKIKPKRSYTSNSVPLTTDLEVNELAIRWTADSPAIFTKNASGQIVTVALGGSGGGGGSSSLVTAATVAGFPATGSTANLYVATDTNRIYRWDATNSIYVELGPLASSGDTLLRSYLVPTAPTGVAATAGNAQVALSWTAAASLSQIPVTDYLIQRSTDNGTTWTLASDTVSTATSATIAGLTNGQSYRWRVAAVNGVGTGAYSTASSAVTPVNAVIVDYLIVAGGGGGGGSHGGGGGAGGYRTGTITPTLGTSYTVTVGSGGAGGVNIGGAGLVGNNSSVFGVVSDGGGRGGTRTQSGEGGATPGGSGGSGGGGAGTSPTTAGAGTSGQGNNGGAGSSDGTAGHGGGGGGAGAAGGAASGSAYAGVSGAGGNGSQWLNGTYYAGGGAGGRWGGGTVGAAGLGGGGTGGTGDNDAPGGNGTAATGGGGGGASSGVSSSGGSGGSGVVIMRASGSVTAASTTGSPTRTESGGYTYYTFTGSGSITF